MVKEKVAIEQYIDAIELDVHAAYVVIHKEQEIVKRTADIIFKYMASQDNRLSQYFRNTIIVEITGLLCEIQLY